MIVTEEEAKTKRCQESFGPPLSAEGVTYMASGTTVAVQTSPTHCIGSGCMAWQWWQLNGASLIDRTKGDDNGKGFCGKAR